MSDRGWPAGVSLSLDVVEYGPGIATEADVHLLGHLEGKRVLQLGCGSGATAIALAKQGAKVIAIDASADDVAAARALAEQHEVKVELHQGDVADLAFVRADTVDAALSVYTLPSVSDPDRAFRQVHRVLRPDAPLVVSLPHPALRVAAAGRSYFDRTDGGQTVSSLFTSLTRANFRVDTILEPERSDGHHPVPETLIIRARKLGT